MLYDKGAIFCLPDIMHAHRSGAKNPSSFMATNKTRAIEYAYMFCRIADALEDYFDYQYNFYALKADRAALLMQQKYIHRYKIDKSEYKKFFNGLGKKTRRKARWLFVQKTFREVLHKIARKLNLFYRVNNKNG